MNVRRLLASACLASLLGLGAMVSLSSRNATHEAEETRGREDRPTASLSDSQPRTTSAPSHEPPTSHPSELARWQAEGHPVSAEAFRASVASELERITLAHTWLTRLDDEASNPSCPRCEPALDEHTRAVVRRAMQQYDETLVAIANSDLSGTDAVGAYRAARESFLEELPFAGISWLGHSGFLDTHVDIAAISPSLHASTRESRPSAAPNTHDDPGMQGI